MREMLVFVYGTLLRGMERGSILATAGYRGPAMLRARLFDLGDYPGIREGEGRVIGELYEVSKVVLDILDEIEGYLADKGRESLFLRREVRVCRLVDGKSVNAFCYFYNLPPKGDPIPHGDYRRYLLERKGGDQWVLAYGSNLCIERLRGRVGEIKEYKRGFIDGFRLVFNKKAKEGSNLYANIAYAGQGEGCPAVAYRLSPEQVGQLDRWEGVPGEYLRITILFCPEAEDEAIMQVYIAHPTKLSREGSPDPQYLALIRQGYQKHGFDLGYLERSLGR